MKIKVSKESVVVQGPAFEDTIWGVCQFPHLAFDNEGNVCCNIHMADDVWEEIGVGNDVWYTSKDGGKTWAPSEKGVSPKVGTLLPNGDRIFFHTPPPIIVPIEEIKHARIFRNLIPSDKIEKMSDGSWPYPIFATNDMLSPYYVYNLDTLPDEYSKKEWSLTRIPAGSDEKIEQKSKIEQPYLSINGAVKETHLVALRPYPICKTKVDPDGNIWSCTYTGAHLNPYTGAPVRFSAVTLYKSVDNGKSFKLQSYIPFIPNADEEPTAWLSPEFNENDIEFMPDGSIIVLMRTTNACTGGPEWTPMYFARSTDGGKTFSKPTKFSDSGVLPSLVKLNCGVTLAAYGRLGIYVRATSDPSGQVWEEPIEIMTPNDRSHLMNNPPERPDFHQYAGSCCNVTLEPLDDHSAILAYSDFYYPDITGKTNKRYKTILTRIISVEE